MTEWDNRSQMSRWPDTRFVEFAMARFRNQPGARFLELGCGAGAQLRFLRESGFVAIGVDRSLAAIMEAGRAAQAYQMDLARPEPMAITDQMPFDCVFDICTLQHLTPEDANVAIIWAINRLKLGGTFFSKWRAPAAYPTPESPGVPTPRAVTHLEIREMFSGLSEVHWGREALDLWPVGRTVAHWIITGRKK